MFGPEAILGMLGIPPEQVEQFKALIPRVMQAVAEADARLKRMEAQQAEILAMLRAQAQPTESAPAPMLMNGMEH